MTDPPNFILADPPWDRMGSGKHPRNAAQPYETMTDAELREWAFQLDRETADTAMLALWCCSHNTALAHELVERAGFQTVSCITWVKSNPQQLRTRWTIPTTELLLLAARGNPPNVDQRHGAGIPTAVTAPKGKHSAKPGIFHDLLELLSEEVGLTRRLEWFAREAQPGWATVGNQRQETLFTSAPDFTGTLGGAL